MKALVIALVCIFAASAVAGASERLPKAMCDDFFASFEAGKTSEAWEKLWEGSWVPQAKPGDVEYVKSKMVDLLGLCGKLIGHDLIREQSFGPSLAGLVYVLKGEKSLVIWRFHFYRPGANWFLLNVNFTADMPAL